MQTNYLNHLLFHVHWFIDWCLYTWLYTWQYTSNGGNMCRVESYSCKMAGNEKRHYRNFTAGTSPSDLQALSPPQSIIRGGYYRYAINVHELWASTPFFINYWITGNIVTFSIFNLFFIPSLLLLFSLLQFIRAKRWWWRSYSFVWHNQPKNLILLNCHSERIISAWLWFQQRKKRWVQQRTKCIGEATVNSSHTYFFFSLSYSLVRVFL